MPGAMEKAKVTNIKRYGVKNPMQNPIVVMKGLTTKQRNGKNVSKTNKIEQRLKLALEKIFSAENVQHQRWFKRHPVDFYIKSIDTWIEHDGEFWHGRVKDSLLKKY